MTKSTLASIPMIRHKHLQLDQQKLDRVKAVLGVKTETEALDRALTLVLDETELNRALKASKGRPTLQALFC